MIRRYALSMLTVPLLTAHAAGVRDGCDCFRGSRRSLSSKRVSDLLLRHGPNIIGENGRNNAFKRLLRQISSPLVIVLLVAGVLTIVLEEYLDATVIFYGQVVDDLEKLTPIQAPVLGLFGENDRVVRTDTVLDFEAALNALEKEAEIEIFAGAGRGFADTHSTKYDAEIAELAWQQTFNFLEQHLRNRSE